MVVFVHGAMSCQIDPSELFLVPAIAPHMV